jgi:hypothetical protein
MKHRYIVWTGHYRGRRFVEMHIIDKDDKPICASWRAASVQNETIYSGRPEGYALCRYCARKRIEFEQAEKLRTWRELAEKPTEGVTR